MYEGAADTHGLPYLLAQMKGERYVAIVPVQDLIIKTGKIIPESMEWLGALSSTEANKMELGSFKWGILKPGDVIFVPMGYMALHQAGIVF